jgi:hypothetical protein
MGKKGKRKESEEKYLLHHFTYKSSISFTWYGHPLSSHRPMKEMELKRHAYRIHILPTAVPLRRLLNDLKDN